MRQPERDPGSPRSSAMTAMAARPGRTRSHAEVISLGNRKEVIGHGNREEERRATPKLALRPDPAAVRADNSSGNGETQACPRVVHLATTPVALEEMLQIFRADPGTVVRDHEQ